MADPSDLPGGKSWSSRRMRRLAPAIPHSHPLDLPTTASPAGKLPTHSVMASPGFPPSPQGRNGSWLGEKHLLINCGATYGVSTNCWHA